MSKLVPELRFSGFSDDWVQRKFFDNIETTIDFRGRTPKKLGMDWSHSGYLALSALNVKDGYIDSSLKANYGNQELYDKWMAGKDLHKNQVIFTTEAPMGNVAQIPTNNKYILSQRVIAFDVKFNLITENFLATLLRYPKTFNDLNALASGGTAKGVSQKSLSSLNVKVPKNINEQQQIGTFFKQLDNTITLHQRKLDLLKKQKTGLLQKMFPKNGSNTPELRFANFDDEWVQHKLGDITKSFSGGTPQVGINDYYGGKIPFIRSGEIHDDKTELFITDKGFKNSSSKMVENGDILYALYGATSGEASISKINGAINQAILAIRPIKNDNSYFIFQWLLKQKKYIIRTYLQGGQGNLSGSIIKSFLLILPEDKIEQEEIGSFFQKLDDTIDLHQHRLNLLKLQKKGLLQKMFV